MNPYLQNCFQIPLTNEKVAKIYFIVSKLRTCKVMYRAQRPLRKTISWEHHCFRARSVFQRGRWARYMTLQEIFIKRPSIYFHEISDFWKRYPNDFYPVISLSVITKNEELIKNNMKFLFSYIFLIHIEKYIQFIKSALSASRSQNWSFLLMSHSIDHKSTLLLLSRGILFFIHLTTLFSFRSNHLMWLRTPANAWKEFSRKIEDR